MKRFSYLRYWCPWLLACVLAGSGCAYDVPLKAEVEATPEIKKLPITVGVYYSPEFRNFTYVGDVGGDLPTYHMGEASVRVFDKVFPAVFRDVVPLTAFPPSGPESAKLDAVIAPEFQEASVTFPQPNLREAGASVTYSFAFYDRDGNRIAAWTVSGSGYKRRDDLGVKLRGLGTVPGVNLVALTVVMADSAAKWELPHLAFLRAPVEAAILTAADRFVTTLPQVQELQGWLSAQNLAALN